MQKGMIELCEDFFSEHHDLASYFANDDEKQTQCQESKNCEVDQKELEIFEFVNNCTCTPQSKTEHLENVTNKEETTCHSPLTLVETFL